MVGVETGGVGVDEGDLNDLGAMRILLVLLAREVDPLAGAKDTSNAQGWGGVAMTVPPMRELCLGRNECGSEDMEGVPV